jgi:hypothetical protein
MKTLKDIPLNQEEWENYEELKQAAIEWIKEIDDGKYEVDDPYCCKPTLINWIKHFFNLTEDELK